MKPLALLLVFVTIVTFTCAVEDIRFCIIGLGPYGTATAKIAIEKGFKMVAAFTRYSKHLKTVGELLGMESDESLSFRVSSMSKLEAIIDEKKPHFCIDASNTTLAGVYPHFTRLIAKGVHILTLANEAVFPDTRFQWKPRQLYRALDTLAKQNNVVILGGAASDSILIPVVPSIAASMMELHRITITSQADIDGADAKYAGSLGVGLTQNEFNEQIDTLSLGYADYWLRSVVEAIAYSMKLPLLDVENGEQQENIALYTRKECYKVENENGVASKALNKVIPNGDCAGVNMTVLGIAKDDIEIIFTLIAGVTSEDVNPMNVLLSGVPDVEFAIKNIDWFIITGASLLHRVPMVLNELSPGFHNVNDLKANTYWRTVSDWNKESTDTDKRDL